MPGPTYLLCAGGHPPVVCPSDADVGLFALAVALVGCSAAFFRAYRGDGVAVARCAGEAVTRAACAWAQGVVSHGVPFVTVGWSGEEFSCWPRSACLRGEGARYVVLLRRVAASCSCRARSRVVPGRASC